MIKLTRLNDSELYVNAVLIEQIEATPDTVVTLTTGKRMLVRETPQQVIERAVDYLTGLREACHEDSPQPATLAQWGRVIK